MEPRPAENARWSRAVHLASAPSLVLIACASTVVPAGSDTTSTTPPTLPPPTASGPRVHTIACGFSHTCGIRSDGTVWCWGADDGGNPGPGILGGGATIPPCEYGHCSSTPVMVPGVSHAVDLTAGRYVTCARVQDGSGWCWGPSERPHRLDDRTDVRGIALTSGGRCVLHGESTIECDGIAIAPTTQFPPGRTVYQSGGVGIVQFAATDSAACLVARDGTVSCWGTDYIGQLGIGSHPAPATYPRIDTPTRVAGISDARVINSGDSTLVVTRADGTVMQWGYEFRCFSVPWDADDWCAGREHTCNCSRTPRAVPALTGAVDVAAGSTFACALLSDGTVWCWGSNGWASLGVGTTSDEYTRTPRSVITLADATELCGGGDHACIRRADGSIACWGRNRHGELGDGTTVTRSRPTTTVGFP